MAKLRLEIIERLTQAAKVRTLSKRELAQLENALNNQAMADVKNALQLITPEQRVARLAASEAWNAHLVWIERGKPKKRLCSGEKLA